MSDNHNSDPRAKSIEGLIAALQIIARHDPKGQGKKYFCGAEHDVIHFYLDGEALPPDSEDGRALEALGFHFDANVGNWAYFT
jgi:hypothetical protein